MPQISAIDCPLPTLASTAKLGRALASTIATKMTSTMACTTRTRPTNGQETGLVIALKGPVGAGKTTLARAIIAALTGEDDVASPTFGLVTTYETPIGPSIRHIDLYRLEDREDVWELGLEDAMTEDICLIEWPDLIVDLLPPTTLLVDLSASNGARRATLKWQENLPSNNQVPSVWSALNQRINPAEIAR
ncbi:MAG: tRNA (adenosine(37)-N6)-threonylcarbamoyltransferase complex ATPase subunit type 1 TsaE [Pseudomonadota bacterium]